MAGSTAALGTAGPACSAAGNYDDAQTGVPGNNDPNDAGNAGTGNIVGSIGAY